MARNTLARQIPLFIHKLDPLGLRGLVVCLVDTCVGGGGDDRRCVCMHRGICDELRLNLCGG